MTHGHATQQLINCTGEKLQANSNIEGTTCQLLNWWHICLYHYHEAAKPKQTQQTESIESGYCPNTII